MPKSTNSRSQSMHTTGNECKSLVDACGVIGNVNNRTYGKGGLAPQLRDSTIANAKEGFGILHEGESTSTILNLMM